MKSITTFAAVLAMAASLAGCGGDNGNLPAPRLFASIAVVGGTATFSGNRNNYVITRTSTGYTVTDNVGADGSNALTNVQTLKFADVMLNLGIGDQSKTVLATELKSLIELYVAFFNRVPEADGLSYWIGQFKAGRTLNLISESFYNAAVQSSALTGYSATMSNADFVTIVYKNVLGRSMPDQGGLDYWSNALAKGTETHGSLVGSILASAHTFKGDATYGYVANLLDNKVTVANYFAVRQGLNYNSPDISITKGMSIASKVTPTDTTAAINAIGISDSAFDLTVAAPAPPAPSFAQVQAIVTQRCASCHSTRPTQPGFTTAPSGVLLQTETQIRQRADRIYQRATVEKTMPFGNATGMSDDERAIIGAWFLAGAN